MRIFRLSLIIPVFFLIPESLNAQIQLPKLVSDGMVLQRDSEVKLWGWAEPGKQITMNFLEQQHQTVTDGQGGWEFVLSNLEAGGPFSIQFVAEKDAVFVEDVWIGDVWVGSGQSNMELSMHRVSPLYPDEIENVGQPLIRYFEVPKTYNFVSSKNNLQYGEWKPVNRETIEQISAVAYFFSKKLNETYDVPIGIILSALGGSPAEAWISEESLKAFPDYYDELQRFKDDDLIEEISTGDFQRIQGWYTELNQKDPGLSGPETWYAKHMDTSGWSRMRIPGYWSETETGDVHGSVWFRKKMNLPKEWAGQPATLELGRIADADSVFVNGTFVGNTTYQYPPRWYTIPEGVLQEGENVIAVRVINESGRGGFIPDKPYELTVKEDTLSLVGEWEYHAGVQMDALQGATAIRWKPGGLYNAMIHPLLAYAIKGVIWYQGESNADRPEDYADLFKTLITEWREHWGQGNFPFLFVQLANFMEAKDEPRESNWALLREAQAEALHLPNTGMATAIDVGEWNDIHPLNKKDVAERLALAARKIAYGEDEIVHSGPQFESAKTEGNRVILAFKHAGGGLVAKGNNEGRLNEFAIAGEDKNFVWANAKIEGDTVVVWSDEVTEPAAVRYAWADNPDQANLYNINGLPAPPFRTDDF